MPHGALFHRLPLSGSRVPCLGRPPGVAWRWLRQPRHGTHSQGFGAYEEDGRGPGNRDCSALHSGYCTGGEPIHQGQGENYCALGLSLVHMKWYGRIRIYMTRVFIGPKELHHLKKNVLRANGRVNREGEIPLTHSIAKRGDHFTEARTRIVRRKYRTSRCLYRPDRAAVRCGRITLHGKSMPASIRKEPTWASALPCCLLSDKLNGLIYTLNERRLSADFRAGCSAQSCRVIAVAAGR
jgi:hypothetical protein